MSRNTMSYKVKQFLMFAGPAAILFCGVVIVPFIYGIYLTFTSWDGIANSKPFVGLANYANAFADADYWKALGRTAVYAYLFLLISMHVEYPFFEEGKYNTSRYVKYLCKLGGDNCRKGVLMGNLP